MLRSAVPRIRLGVAVLGCAVLGASLFDWAQGLRAVENSDRWVRTDTSSAPALDTAEIWRASARCVRPYFVDAVRQSKRKLKDYYDLAPAEVRASQTPSIRGESLVRDDEQRASYRPADDRQDVPRRNTAALERGAMLHARYAEWYANVFNLEIQAWRWERRLTEVADQSVMLSEATRRSFGAYSGRGLGRPAVAGDFDRYVLVLLGLGGFPAGQEQALRADCVKFIPVKKIRHSANYLGEIWRWPVDRTAAFSFGLELMLIAIFFVPIDLWVATGDFGAAKAHIEVELSRFAQEMRSLGQEYAVAFFRIARAIFAAVRGILTARTNPGSGVGEVRFVSKLAQIRVPIGFRST